MGAAVSAVVAVIIYKPCLIYSETVNLSRTRCLINSQKLFTNRLRQCAQSRSAGPSNDSRQMAMIRDEERNQQLLHFGVSGVVKGGKSSLLNSFRPEYALAWYDIAGFW